MLDKAPNGKVSDLLDALDKALSAAEVDRAVDLFQDDGYWRDLVTFTWNIKTMEGKEQIRAMLKARLADTRPSNWKIAEGEDASEADGITESWIQFETAVARGFGHLRLKDGRILDVADDDERTQGARRAAWLRPSDGGETRRRTPSKNVEGRTRGGIAELGFSRQPYCVIVGGGQGGIALAARLRQLNVPTIIVEKNEKPGDSWRKRYKSLCLHDPVWYDHLPYLPFPAQMAGVLAEGQDRRLARNVHQGDGAQLLGLDRMQEGILRREQPRMDRCRAARRQGNHPPAKAAGACDGNVSQAQHAEDSKAWISSRAISTIPRSIRGRTNTRTARCVVIGSNNSAHDICAALWEAGADVTMVQRSIDPHREVGLADGARIGRALLRAGGPVRA